MRKVVTISMPGEMHEHLVRRLSRTRYATVSEYIRDLIRRDDPGHGEPKKSTAPASVRQSDRDPRIIVRTFNETIRMASDEE